MPALELAERLVGIVPDGLGKVFYSDSGAEAVEIALKMAIGYWRRLGRYEKRTLLSMRNAYHGDTVGAVSVGGIELFHAEFEPLLFPTRKVSYPYPYRYDGTEAECTAACLAELEADLAANADQTAALVVEPIVQGAAGMIVMPPGFLRGRSRALPAPRRAARRRRGGDGLRSHRPACSRASTRTSRPTC